MCVSVEVSQPLSKFPDMNKIAFIDDDQRVLDGLRRSMRKKRGELDCYYYDSGQALVAALDEHSFDIVISDMRMPQMNGVEVLLEVKRRHPDSVRIILSGYSEDQLIIESLQAAHQFIAKPADADTIQTCIERTLAVRKILDNRQLRDQISSIESLPALPEVYNKLMREMSSENCSIDTVGEIVEQDIALSANVLKLVNSAFFSLVRHIESTHQAVAYLGIETIKNLAVASSVFAVAKVPQQEQARIAQLSHSGLQVSRLTTLLCKTLGGLDKRFKDHAQMASMLLGAGELIGLLMARADTAREGDQLAEEELGSFLLGIWGLPFPLVEAVRWHKQPSEVVGDSLTPLTLVHAAWAMTELLKESDEIDLASPIIDADYLRSVVGEDTLQQWKAVAEEVKVDE